MWNPQARHETSPVSTHASGRVSDAAAEARKEQELRECVRRHKVY